VTLKHYAVDGCGQSRKKKVVDYRYEKGHRFNVFADDGPKAHICTEDPNEVTCRNCKIKMASSNVTDIRWRRAKDGYVHSHCGRFRIIPEFCGRVRPLWYRVEDTKPGGLGMATLETQKKCKEWVERGLNPPKDDRDWPEITEDML